MKSNAIPTPAPMIEVIMNHLRLYRGGLGGAAGGAAASAFSGWLSGLGSSVSGGVSGTVVIGIPAGVVLTKGSANGSDSSCSPAEPLPANGAA